MQSHGLKRQQNMSIAQPDVRKKKDYYIFLIFLLTREITFIFMDSHDVLLLCMHIWNDLFQLINISITSPASI